MKMFILCWFESYSTKELKINASQVRSRKELKWLVRIICGAAVAQWVEQVGWWSEGRSNPRSRLSWAACQQLKKKRSHNWNATESLYLWMYQKTERSCLQASDGVKQSALIQILRKIMRYIFLSYCNSIIYFNFNAFHRGTFDCQSL